MAESKVQGEWTLPDGWAWTTLESVATVQSGVGFPKVLQGRESGDYPLAKVSDISDAVLNNDSVLAGAANYVTEEEARQIGGKVYPSGATLFAKIGEAVRLNRRAIAAVPLLADNNVMGLIPSDGEFAKYIFYFMHTVDLYEYARATTVPSVRKSDVSDIRIPLAPLPEQRRIVAAIETQFTRLDAGIAALERARANLRRYKAAVLKAACEGRLVPTEAELARRRGAVTAPLHTAPLPYEPADRLLARILAERRARWEAAHPGKRYIEPAAPNTEGLPELPEGWVWVDFEQLISGFRSGSTAVPGDEPTGFPILRSSSVRPLKVDYKDVRFVTEAESRNADNFLQEGDLLFTRLSGSLDYVGNCALVKGPEFRGIQHPDRLFKARLVEPSMGQYVEVCFASPRLRKKVMSRAKSTAGHQRVSMGGITEQVLPLPPLAEQHRIVAEVERRLSVVAALEREVEAALARAARLRQSILKRAFEGRLVPTEMESYRRGEGTSPPEPASTLLKRIQAQREDVATTPLRADVAKGGR